MKVKFKLKETERRKDNGLNSSRMYQKYLRKIKFDIWVLK